MSTNPLLQEERDKASFNVEEMTNLIDGGKERTERRREIEGWILNDPVWDHEPLEFLSRVQQYELQLRKGAMALRLLEEKNINGLYEKYYVKSLVLGRQGSCLDLHVWMFVPTLLGQGTGEQVDRWVPLAMGNQIIGTYAQTEMGHGTFLRGIETTATYDPDTEEFVLHSPTTTSIKWWPGSLGKTSNHAVVMAQLYTQGKCHGPHLFIMRIRDQNTHEPLPGITLGDIGPKFGFGPMDNGFMRLQHVRVPRDQMLMRHAEVTPDGCYSKRRAKEGSGGEKLSYGTMVMVRALLLGDAARGLMEAVTIAARYSCIRVQGENPNKPGQETKIIDYPTQQYKIIPLVATVYAFYFCGEDLRNSYFDVAAEIAEGNLDRLPELHALSSCLKAYGTDRASAGIEVCRKACGGHGYSLASGIPQIYMAATPACTYEGENTVLYLQTARYLLKCYQSVRERTATQLPASVAYLAEDINCERNPSTVEDLDWLVRVHQLRAKRMLWRIGEEFQRLLSNRVQWKESFDRVSVRLVRCVLAHARQYVLWSFVKVVRSTKRGLQPVLLHLAHLFALQTIVEESGDFLQNDCITSATLSKCQVASDRCLTILRPDLVALVDSFDIPDKILNSVLGRYDGQVYDNLLKWAQRSPFNRQEVLPSYFSTILPFVRGEPLPPLSKL